MVDTRQYLIFVRSVFSSDVTKLNYDKATDTHHPLTKRQYIDYTFKHLLRVSPDKFIPVKPSDFIKDYELGPRQSVWMERLGWDYPRAIDIVQQGDSILMYTCHPSHTWHFVAMNDFIHEEETGLNVVLELGQSVGLETIFTEYQPTDSQKTN
jgi:hypothetical protein